MNYLHEHLTNQESILQSTRGLHYVFQAIFLGIGFAILAISYSVLGSLNVESSNWKMELLQIFSLFISNICIVFMDLSSLRIIQETCIKEA